jgi:hypothetical protein
MATAQADRMSPRTRFFFTRVFPAPFIVIGAVTFFFGVRGLHRAWESAEWPVADGMIKNSAVEYKSSDDGGGTYFAEVFYQFAVDGKTHSGNKVAFGDYGSNKPSHAQKIVNRYPIGLRLQVHYRPSDPDVCVLEPGVKGQTWFLPGFGLIFFAAGVLMAVFMKRLPAAKGTGEQTAETADKRIN